MVFVHVLSHRVCSGFGLTSPFASKTLNMEYGVRPAGSYHPRRPSGYFDAFVQDTQITQNSGTWLMTLACLKSQKRYLDDVLSKTATTLNALRDRQSRNDRVLSATLGPRSKKKKISQNRWRTDKTIKTCENEERVIVECLQVCENNIHTLESILYPMGTWTTVASRNLAHSKHSHTDSATTNFDWNGWEDEGPTSPFQRQKQQHALILDEIPPEAHIHGISVGSPSTFRKAFAPRHPPPLSPCVHARPLERLLPVPPGAAQLQSHHSVLSPEATPFEPHRSQTPIIERTQIELDKLSISGLLASKRMCQILGRRCSDAAIEHVFQGLLHDRRPDVETTHEGMNWGPDPRQYHAGRSSAVTATPVKRPRSA